jgi:predicted dehydrogenase
VGVSSIGIGLIGSGFIGKVHALGYRAAPAVFDLARIPRLAVLADIDVTTAAAAAADLGFERSTGDWTTLVDDPDIDLVDITVPNQLHEEMALAAIAAGKMVYCEKPVAPTAAGAARMVAAAEAANIRTMVGFNYLKNPIAAVAREIIVSGEIGDVFGYRGRHFEDYMHDPESLVNAWRLDPATGDGVTSDLGSHAISMARYLVGNIVEVSAQRTTLGRDHDGPVAAAAGSGVPDTMEALVRFEGGASGVIEASWVAAGHKHTIAAEVFGTKGTLAFDYERLNELRLYPPGQSRGREGFTTILAGPDHPDFRAFVPAPGHQLGFNDLKTIEIRDLLDGADPANPPPWPDFREAWEVQKVVDAVIRSDRERQWVGPAEV